MSSIPPIRLIKRNSRGTGLRRACSDFLATYRLRAIQGESWTSWERHPAGEELVFLISGHVDLIQDLDGEEHRIELHAGDAVLNPPGVWHTSDVYEPGDALFITPGQGTEHRPR